MVSTDRNHHQSPSADFIEIATIIIRSFNPLPIRLHSFQYTGKYFDCTSFLVHSLQISIRFVDTKAIDSLRYFSFQSNSAHLKASLCHNFGSLNKFKQPLTREIDDPSWNFAQVYVDKLFVCAQSVSRVCVCFVFVLYR